jgi:hypothetical protein
MHRLRLFKYLEVSFILNFIVNSIKFMNNMKVFQTLKNLIVIFIDYFLRTFCSNQIDFNRKNHYVYFITPTTY